MATQGQAKVLGPFEVIQDVGPEGRVVASIPYAEVRGSQIIINVIDNFARQTIGVVTQNMWAAAEVAIFGSVQASTFCLKRQYCRMLTGPMFYIAPDEEAYDQIQFRGRNLSGGQRGDGEGMATAANGFSLQLQILIQPRGGLGPKRRFSNMG